MNGFNVNIFQLTRSRGAWRDACMVCNANPNFNSHAHVERDFVKITLPVTNNQISTHTLTWSVTESYTNCHNSKWFQLTRSRGAWLHHLKCFPILQIFQLTRSRGAWHANPRVTSIYNPISTHTLTWSVTNRRYAIIISLGISTHTLTWSVTVIDPEIKYEELNFNSHAHVERDSCHATPQDWENHFNSHAHVERDEDTACLVSFITISTHTLTWSVT